MIVDRRVAHSDMLRCGVCSWKTERRKLLESARNEAWIAVVMCWSVRQRPLVERTLVHRGSEICAGAGYRRICPGR
jgi:hypothetical protein